jgi:hypothetical protein
MIRRKKPWVLSSAAMLMTAFSLLFFANWAQLHAVVAPEFNDVERQAKEAEEFQNKKDSEYKQAKAAWDNVKKRGLDLTGNVDRRLQWLEVLKVINDALPENPANVDRKKLMDLSELQISDIAVTWYDDVKKDWYDKVTNDTKNIWIGSTLHPLDKAIPPTGSGWVFTLLGYHFNTDKLRYTRKAAFARAHGLWSAPVRQVGISSPVLVLNIQDSNWDPRKQDQASSKNRREAKRPAGGGGGRATAKSSGGVMGGGGGGMGMAPPGGGEESTAPAMEVTGGDTMGQSQRGGDAPAAPAATADTGPLPRTSFKINFVWQPIEQAKRKKLQEIEAALTKAGAPKELEVSQGNTGPAATAGARPTAVSPNAPASPGKAPAGPAAVDQPGQVPAGQPNPG